MITCCLCCDGDGVEVVRTVKVFFINFEDDDSLKLMIVECNWSTNKNARLQTWYTAVMIVEYGVDQLISLRMILQKDNDDEIQENDAATLSQYINLQWWR